MLIYNWKENDVLNYSDLKLKRDNIIGITFVREIARNRWMKTFKTFFI